MCLPNILSPVFMFAFIFHCRSFSPCWPLAFLIFLPPLWMSMFFFLRNSSPFFSITRSSSFSVKKYRRKRHDFVVVFSFKKSGRPRDFLPNKTLSCIWVVIPVDWVILYWYPCGADGRSLSRSVYGHMITKFSAMGRLPHFLSYGARAARGAPL